MKITTLDKIIIVLFTILAIALATLILYPFAVTLDKMTQTRYTTYETGLYVESENIQPARGDLQ